MEADRQIGRWTGRQADRQMEAGRQIGRWTGRQAGR